MLYCNVPNDQYFSHNYELRVLEDNHTIIGVCRGHRQMVSDICSVLQLLQRGIKHKGRGPTAIDLYVIGNVLVNQMSSNSHCPLHFPLQGYFYLAFPLL